ncbi:MAG: hypothetical protein CM15mV51_1200 [uncultured marine virus]|nr:MAG: hypothetical protein CM15mV51_1200 [uncultured marine virus]
MLQKAANNEQMSASENNAIFRQFLIADRITGFNSNLASVQGMVNGYGKSMIDIEE